MGRDMEDWKITCKECDTEMKHILGPSNLYHDKGFLCLLQCPECKTVINFPGDIWIWYKDPMQILNQDKEFNGYVCRNEEDIHELEQKLGIIVEYLKEK